MGALEPIVATLDEFRGIRRDIHAHPELKYEESRTADLVAAKLSEWGIEVTRGLGKTGLVGKIKAGGSARSIGLRADMDALPVQEANDFAHRSVHPGKMHACGHDGHTTMLLAAAKHLAASRNFDGTVHLIFQPAEEGGGAGARAMIEDGLFKRFPCDAVFGLHNRPAMKVGAFGVRPGPMLASSSQFEIVVKGRGGHAAYPHDTVDPIAVGAQIHLALQTVISRNKRPIDAGVLSVTQFNAGSATNIIPDDAVLRGTVRTFTVEVLDLIESSMRRITGHVAAAHGASVEFNLKRSYPPTINHVRETQFAVEVMRDLVGSDNVDAELDPSMGGEDFSFMLLEQPGCYAFIGNGEGGHRDAGHADGPCLLHNPTYDFNDELIALGASYWVRTTWISPHR